MTRSATPTFVFDNPFSFSGFGESIGSGGFHPVAFLDQMLSDPMIRLVMTADGVSEAEIRQFYRSRPAQKAQSLAQRAPVPDGSGPRPGSSRPGIGE